MPDLKIPGQDTCSVLECCDEAGGIAEPAIVLLTMHEELRLHGLVCARLPNLPQLHNLQKTKERPSNGRCIVHEVSNVSCRTYLGTFSLHPALSINHAPCQRATIMGHYGL